MGLRSAHAPPPPCAVRRPHPVRGAGNCAIGVPDFTLRFSEGEELARFDTGGPVVSGEPADLLAWPAGRASGARLDTTGDLPVLPPWL
ncbi:hypothetical protein [Streptomyces scabichelini]|uniref:hypothetical protein n=1 Tax=Streptomyces scabichelini TaxID=2711217 RepID=UPI0030B9BDE3